MYVCVYVVQHNVYLCTCDQFISTPPLSGQLGGHGEGVSEGEDCREVEREGEGEDEGEEGQHQSELEVVTLSYVTCIMNGLL